jgi:aryl-alcohol dehydrogenase-like predicted oxidoreductase
MVGYSRRRFLAGSSLCAAGLALGAAPLGQALAAEPASMLARPLPGGGGSLPVIGAGTSGSYDVDFDSPAYAQLVQAIAAFFEGGGRVIDTSPNYGRSDEVLGRLLAEGGWRERCFLATKIAGDDAGSARAQWARSLQRLRTDHVELLQVHNLRDWKRQLAYARELKAQGKTRYVGVTHFTDAGLPELEQILRSERLDFIQIHYSVNVPSAARTVLPLARDKGVSVIINRAFDDGRLFARVKDQPLPAWAGELGITSWAQVFLKFVISHPAVTVVIPATGKPERQVDQLKAGHGPLLDAAQQQELIQRFSA